MAEKAKHYRGLNGLRAIAVALVFLVHKTNSIPPEFGKSGVWLFFFISGFLIIGELHRARRSIESGQSTISDGLQTFFVKRALRIFPIYYLLLAALFVGRRFYAHYGPDLGFAWHFTYLSNFWMALVLKDWIGPFSHLWSLAVEQQFYLIAPFAFLLLPTRFHGVICAVCLIVGISGHELLYAYGSDEIVEYTISPFNFSLLASGGLMYFAVGRGMRVVRPVLAAAVAIILILGSWCMLLSHIPDSAKALSDLCLSAGIALVFFIVVTNQRGLLTRCLEWSPLNYLGTISYGFYLFHNFIPNPIGKALQLYPHINLPDGLQSALGLTSGFALTVVVASFSWRFIERPIMQLRQRRTAIAPPSTA
ncbi:acyltransferase [Burkholderia sp. S171]|uniref:acyltransferase family protein n=1 Tax=Burkholderia sp. S171 TaxID=1641860 RepID=UPI00131CC0F2|nr:acyltransferase [Burkholderia sp. S171]